LAGEQRGNLQFKKTNLISAGVLSFGMLLAACGPATVAEPAASPPPTPLQVAETVPPTVAFTATTPPATPTNIPTPTAELVVDNCVDCHADKDRLIDTADAVMEVTSENEGEG
jgi:mono/diheme cytochrome c family protein